MKRFSSLILGMALAAVLAAEVRSAPPAAQPWPSARLHLVLVDGTTGQPVPARVDVIGADGMHYFPTPRSSHFYHEAYFGHRYFYAEGECDLDVPPGDTVIRVFHGFEYGPVVRELDVREDVTARVELFRQFDMPASGWRSGDTHVHLAHGGLNVYNLTSADIFLMQRAEDLHVASVLENGYGFSGHSDPLSTDNYRLFFGIEYRSAFWGHLGVLGTSALTSFGCCSRGQPAYPMNVDLSNRAHELGGTVIFAHPITLARSDIGITDQGWPSVGHGRGLPVDVALGAVDAIDVFSYSNRDKIELKTWYDLLNHGFHLPATAGTDASMNRFIDPPLGGYRVYARVGSDWSYEGWLAAIRRGESFVTNGPLIREFRVADQPPGSVVSRPAGAKSFGYYYDVVSAWPITSAWIVVNGRPTVRLLSIGGDSRRLNGFGTMTLPAGSAWVALRIDAASTDGFTIGGDLMAHTSPVYVEVPGLPVRFGGANPMEYVQWVDDVLDLAVARGFSSAEERETVLQRCIRAREILFDRTILTPNKVGETGPDPEFPAGADAGLEASAAVVAEPNPSRSNWTFRFGHEAPAPEFMELYDVTGRRLTARRVRLDDLGPDGWTWSPEADGLDLRPGVYYARFLGPGWSRSLRLIRLS